MRYACAEVSCYSPVLKPPKVARARACCRSLITPQCKAKMKLWKRQTISIIPAAH